jgi:acetylornithine deacetylase
MTAAQILEELIAIPSVSHLSNVPLLQAIERHLASAGWLAQRLPYIAADGLEKANLLAVPAKFSGALPALELMFVCHTDTVPYRQSWSGATRLNALSDNLHGCGACDVKGAMAGLLAAAQQAQSAAIERPVAFVFTAEEEIGCIGAARLADAGVIRANHAIVCEPTSLRPAVAGKGYGLAQVIVSGHEAHSAFPAKGNSAIGGAAHFIVALESEQATRSRVNPLFNPPWTTFNVGVIQGGTAKNIVAGECTFLVEWRPLPDEDPVAGGELIERVAEAVAARTGCAIAVDVMRADRGFSNPAKSFGLALSTMLGRAETGISFGSEATRLAQLAGELVVLGPGDMESAHSDREFVPARELEEWTSFVRNLLLHGVPGA